MSLLTSTLRRAARHLRGPAPASNPEANRLAALPRAHCDPRHLGYFSPEWLAETFRQPSIDAHWSADRARIDSLGMPDMTGGVNPGDRRALYYLAGRLKPKTILEVGTHIGSSTVALALAAARNLADGITTRIVTVDIRDVNDEQARPWAAAGSPASPAALLQLLGLAESVQFETGTAVERLNAQVGGGTFDLIFLDGDHSAEAVYREIPLALKRLSPGGVIVLHDFFPNGHPLWDGQAPILGPWLAAARFQAEQSGFEVVPLGALPWHTKLGSQITSLAVVSQPLDAV